MTTYLINTAVLTAFGRYTYAPVSLDEARAILAGGFTSAVGHEGTAAFCRHLFAMPAAYQRINIEMQPGDRAVVVRVKGRLPEGAILSLSDIQQVAHELGLLTREQ